KKFIASGAASSAPVSVAGDADIPASAAILGSDEASGLAQALDEHGLPDPLSLLRKPVADILQPIAEQPVRRPIMDSAIRDHDMDMPQGMGGIGGPDFGFG